MVALVAACLGAGCSSGPPGGGAGGQAPAQYRVQLDTSKGAVVIEVRSEWAPKGAGRFHELVKNGFYDQARFFRVLPGFVVQFGMHADPSVNSQWQNANIADDPPSQSNVRGTVTFATRGPNSRTTQIFINVGDNAGLDAQGFTPFGRVTSGMDAVAQFYAGYGEGAPMGAGPSQQEIAIRGNAYLIESFPQLDYIRRAAILP